VFLSNIFEVPIKIDGTKVCFNVVTRTANRLLFNIPLTRNKTWHQLSIDYTYVMFGGADKVRKWPEWFKPVVMWWSTKLYETQAAARALLMPLIEDRVSAERLARANGTSKSRKKEEDMVQWIMDYATDEELDPNRLFYRMLHINIAAVHTSSTTFAEVLYAAIVHPVYQEELRQEIVDVFRQECGWSKQALTLLYKMDSFMTECGRYQPNASRKY
jgi:cytochrome P450